MIDSGSTCNHLCCMERLIPAMFTECSDDERKWLKSWLLNKTLNVVINIGSDSVRVNPSSRPEFVLGEFRCPAVARTFCRNFGLHVEECRDEQASAIL